MALYGSDVPNSKKPVDASRREQIFSIVAPYCLSRDDLNAIAEYPDNIKDMWLMTFTNSQSVMLGKLLTCTKEYFRKYFPSGGASPKTSLGKKIGLDPGQSILDR